MSFRHATETKFGHERIDPDPPCGRLTFCLATDLTGNGRDDVIVGGMGSRHHLYVDGARTRLPSLAGLKRRLGLPETNLFWYENPGWERHAISDVDRLGVGHDLLDVDGDGRVDILAGQALHNHDLYWFRQPDDPREEWERRLITDRYEKYHDVLAADVDDDGDPEVVGLSQESGVVFYYDVPADPTVEPWPDSCRHVVATDTSVEGVATLDADGDGRTELVAGTGVYHRPLDGDGEWRREPIVEGWDDVRAATADLDDDGDLELLLAEGDSPTYGTHPGRVAWFDPPDWEQHLLANGLFCPHTLRTADFTGDGRPDVFVGEMGLGENDSPENRLFVNEGDGSFREEIVGRGIATHEAAVADLTGDGRPDVAGKSYGPNCHVDAWYNKS